MSVILHQFVLSLADAGVFIGLFLSAREFLYRQTGEPLNPHFFFSTIGVTIHLRLNWFLRGEITDPYAYIGVLGGLFLLGPWHYIQVLHIFNLVKRRLLLYLGHSLVLIPVTIFEIQHFTGAGFFTEVTATNNPINLWVFGIFFIWNMLYYGAIFRLINREKKKYSMEYSNRLYVFISIPIPVVLSGIIVAVIGNYALLLAVSAVVTVAVSTILYFVIRNPQFFDAIQFEIDRQRYRKTQLKGINIDGIKDRIEELMEKEELYKDDDLRLQDLAAQLKVSTNQLSRIINEQYGKNFYQFINAYRIKEAKRLLIDEPEASALDIGLAVGYNSKSAFYKNFAIDAGVTPVEFRKSRT